MPIKRLTVVAALVSLLLVAGSLQAKVVTNAKAKAPVSAHVASHSHTTAKHTAAKATHKTSVASKASEKTSAKTVHASKSHAVANSKTHSATKSHSVASAHTTHGAAKAHKKGVTHSVAKAHVTHKEGGVARADNDSSSKAVTSEQSDASSLTVDSSLLASTAAASLGTDFVRKAADGAVTLSVGGTDAADDVADATIPDGKEDVTDLRKALIGLAMNLRDTRYVRGGRDPATGFDCSGFVRYVFSHAIGIKLPTNSAAQFLDGLKVSRGEMKPGDLVFFHTGRRHRISHVGIYISNGRFIHSPATGKSVQVSSLSESYWAKHFAGAKRPEAIALAAHNG